MARAGETPDINTVGCELLGSAVDKGWVMCLDKFVTEEDKENVYEMTIKGAMVDGRIYAWPFWGGVFGTLYNKRLVMEAGLDPDNLPETWDEYLEWVLKMNNPPVYGYVGMWKKDYNLFQQHLGRLYSNGGALLNDDFTKCLLDQPEAVETLRFWTDLYTKYNAVPPGPTTYSYPELTRDFAYEVAATMQNCFWALPKLLGDNPEGMKDNILIGPNPYRKIRTTYAKIVYLTIGANSKHPDMAWEFIKYINSREAVAERAIRAQWMPFRKDVINTPEVQNAPELKIFLGFMESAKTNPNVPQINEIKDIVIEMVQSVLVGQATPEEASIKATKEIDEIIAR